MARTPETINVKLAAELSRDLEGAVRGVIRDELRRLSTELVTQAMRERSEVEHEVQPLKDHTELHAWFMERLADVIQASAKKSEMEERQ